MQKLVRSLNLQYCVPTEYSSSTECTAPRLFGIPSVPLAIRQNTTNKCKLARWTEFSLYPVRILGLSVLAPKDV